MMRRIISTYCGPYPMTTMRNFSATSLLLSKVIPFKLADIGEGILHVEVLQVFVKVGDQVKAFDKICEVQSDKATVEITSRYDGIVKAIHIAKGATANVGQAIAELEVDDNTPGEGISPKAAEMPTSVPSSGKQVPQNDCIPMKDGKVLTTPATRRIAKENKIDLSKVKPTGKGGRIMKEDVLAFMEQGSAPSKQSAYTVAPVQQDRVISLEAGVRRAMVKSMTEANQIPAFGACDEIEMTETMNTRKMLKPLFLERSMGKVNLTFLPFFLKAASMALLQFPEINAHTNKDCSQLIIKSSHNISFAMDSTQGLIVPNLKDVQCKSIYQIAEELNVILEKGKSGQVSRENLEGGTFTLSNIGNLGATYAAPIIFPPQVAIGALGSIQMLPRFNKKGEIYPANVMKVSWAADHRVVDGASMVRFSNLFKKYLESPVSMIADMK